ncbi:hypothetical protein BU26DRAFT_515505 [Trematosphaeria pertusa]|uniref:ARM repeat-containing protein n=1 Tax=Trematosphaeria pertusa TaxID=390896 RepID=A0A6A6IRN4_9PLEO|nr:uncharacterized protein BU26DRAFT_515505 [Trematosphaeria pertusa]KAF2253131.1 hypothetical protein BU26DRAFT_515505 [Trematosphaeria pertusa]
MARTIEDRWLWLGLGVFTFVAIKGVAHGLRHIVTLTEVHNAAPRPTIPLPGGKEDAIKTSSLQTLATCSNVEIRKAATKIMCERFISNPVARTLLLKDLQSSDPETQHRAHLAVNLLSDYDVLQHHVAPPSTPLAYRGNGGDGSRRTLPWLRSGTRNHERDPEERDLRRRRREAMVINEGDRPISQQDVWMRDGDGRMSTEEPTRP